MKAQSAISTISAVFLSFMGPFALLAAISATFLSVSTIAVADLLVSNNDSNEILRYDSATGAFIGVFASGGGLDGPVDLVFGPDDNLYVSSETTNSVKRFDGATGAYIDDFVPSLSGGLRLPYGLVFGPDDNLYVAANFFERAVIRYDGSSGAFIDSFAEVGDDPTGITFGPIDGNLYVGSQLNDTIVSFSGTTGGNLGVFASTDLDGPRGVTFGPDGNLYVSSFQNDAVLKYDGTTGASMGVFASGGGLDRPEGLIFGPDGNLYVSGDGTSNSVHRFNGTTGAFIDVFASGPELSSPRGLAFITNTPPPPPPFVTENRTTESVELETDPVLGNDGLNYVVYTEKTQGPLGLGPGRVILQRLDSSGVNLGAPIALTLGSTDDELPDVSGNNVVYMASSGTLSSLIRMYDISLGTSVPVTSVLADVRSPAISEDVIVWEQVVSGASLVLMQRVSLVGTGTAPMVLRGPGPSAQSAQVGERYAVWDETVGLQRDVRALDHLPGGNFIVVAIDPDVDEFNPSTSFDWIVWQEIDAAGVASIQGENFRTGVRRTILASGADQNSFPTVDDDLVTYEIVPPGQTDRDVFVYRLSTDETFQVTNHPADQFANNLLGNLVAYEDTRDNLDIFVASLGLPPGDPPVNLPPVADAGIPVSGHPGDLVSLDGSASSDPDGNTPLTFDWSVTIQPAGGNATLSDATVSNPTLTFDAIGNYTVSLVVTDSLGTPSAPDLVVVSTFNTAPVADAGEDQLLTELFTSIQLDGTQSFDNDGDDLGYFWALATPAQSTASLDDAASSMPSFTADIQGDYTAELTVTDIFGATSDPAQVTLSFSNLIPVADSGGDQSINAGTFANLDGSGSSDANNDPLQFNWSFVSIPPGSSAVIADPSSAQTSFLADIEGNYIVSLVVNDGIADSAVSNKTVLATTAKTKIIAKLQETTDAVNDLPDDSLKNKNLKKPLTNKVRSVIELVVEEQNEEARSKLNNDIGAKFDGCQESGKPDKNDWITNCEGQSTLTKLKVEAVELLDEEL